jgi:hypothetical protein
MKNKQLVCENCESRPASTRYRSAMVCSKCEDILTNEERNARGSNLEEYEQYDEEDAIAPYLEEDEDEFPKKNNPTGSSYLRVIPRDLFNESKLLKCLGKISLYIHDNLLAPYNASNELENPEEGFIIEQSPDDGSIHCSNYIFMINGQPVSLYTPLNSRGNWPLLTDNYINVFEDDGTLSDEFLLYISNI